MMRCVPKLLLLSTLPVWAALGQPAQNSDIGILSGPVPSTALAVAGSGTVNIQLNYAYSIHSYSFADLWIEWPFTTVVYGTAYLNGVSAPSLSATFNGPGVHLHVPVGKRVSFYGAMGGGYGKFEYYGAADPQGRIDTGTTYHGAFDYGGGADLRLTRLLGLRGDVRDYVTGRGLGWVSGRNHVLLGFGVAFHF